MGRGLGGCPSSFLSSLSFVCGDWGLVLVGWSALAGREGLVVGASVDGLAAAAAGLVLLFAILFVRRKGAGGGGGRGAMRVGRVEKGVVGGVGGTKLGLMGLSAENNVAVFNRLVKLDKGGSAANVGCGCTSYCCTTTGGGGGGEKAGAGAVGIVLFCC